MAAATARASVLGAYAAHPGLDATLLRGLIEGANDAVVAKQQEGGPLAAMRTTAVLVAIDLHSHEMAWGHCGDSRAYLFRNGAVVARTTDHSVVQQLRKAGLYKDEDLRQLPHRNVLVGAVGADSQVPPSVLQQAVDLHAGDAFLLCSDGLWDRLDEPAMEAALKRCPSPAVWLDRMAQTVLAAGRPDQDNLSALAVWIAPGDDEAGAEPALPPAAEPDPS